MARIPAYKFTPRTLTVYPELWDAKKQQLKPIKKWDGVELYAVLDSIALAAEAGSLDSFTWPQQIFANRRAFEAFIEELAGYDYYRITDQWWTALAELAEAGDETGMVSCDEIANALMEVASSDGRIENFGRKAPKYLYAAKQCINANLALAKYSGSGWLDSVLPTDEVESLRIIARYGRHHAEQPTAAQVKKAYRDGEVIAKSAAAAAKKAPAKKSAAKSPKKK